MDLRQLKYFVATAEELHFGRAAKRLFISQPALSFDIRRLELKLGVELLIRNSKGVALTGAGTVLLRESKRLLEQASEVERLTVMTGHGLVGRLKIGFVSSMLYRALPEAIHRFQKMHQSTDIVLHEMNTAEQLDALHRTQIDVGFGHFGNYPPNTCGKVILIEPFLCCLPISHHLANQPTIDLSSLAQENFILFPRDVSPQHHDKIIALCIDAGFSPLIKHEVRLWQTIVGFVEKKMGVALVPQTMSRTSTKDIVYIPLSKSKIFSETHCLWNKKYPLDKIEPFVATLEDEMAKIVRQPD